MTRAVLDTSVLVSAFLTPQGTAAQVLEQAERGRFVLCLSSVILEETRDVLLRAPKLQARYHYSVKHVDALCEGLALLAELVTDLPDLKGVVALDAKDDRIVATAVAADADHLVTGDRRHLLALEHYERVQIVTPRAFLDRLD